MADVLEAGNIWGPIALVDGKLLIRDQKQLKVLQVAQRESCDLIIMGAFGHSRMRELFVGSTTDGILRSAEIPVLLYR